MRIRVRKAFGSLCHETFVIIYWIGLWQLFAIGGFFDHWQFNLACLMVGSVGLFLVKAVEPAFVLCVVDETNRAVRSINPAAILNFRR